MLDISSFKDKTVVITGATGLIGSNIVNRLMTVSGIRIVVIGRSIKRIEETFPGCPNRDAFVPIECDISKSFPKLDFDIDIILHAAGPIAGSIIKDTPVNVIKPNLYGLLNCLEFVRKQKEVKGINCRLVVFSSATVYSNSGNRNITFSEENTEGAENIDSITAPYSESKRMCEIIAKAYQRQYSLDVIIARFAYIYGYTRKMPDTAFYEFIQKSLKGESLILNSTCAPKRDNLYVDDAVEGLLYLVKKGVAGESYNISSGGDLGNFAAIDEIADIIATSANKNVKEANISVTFRKYDKERKPGIILDNSKLKDLGWRVEYSLVEGINKTLISYKA